MIKIQLDSITKGLIEKLIIEDAKTARTGVIRLLKNSFNAGNLSYDHPRLYRLLFDCRGYLKEDTLIKLLLADKNEMLQYIKILGKYEDTVYSKDADDLLRKYFRYENFASRNVAIKILRKIDARVCPYCNRQYTITINNGKVRPQFDHFFPKVYYPYLALSIWNLIPSCSICNMAKSNLDTVDVATEILYPYDEEFGEEVIFKLEIPKKANHVRVMQGLSEEFKLHICDLRGSLDNKVKKQNEQLHLEDLYNEHKDYVMDIVKGRNINTDSRVNELLKRHPLLFKSKDEILNILYLTDMRKEKWGKRPLSKLTRDIYSQI